MQMKMIVFAMDGVICHLDQYHYLAWKTIADELGIPFSKEQGKELIGLSRMDSLRYILQGYPGTISEAEKKVLAEQKNLEFRRIIESLSPADCDAGVKEILMKLRAQGYLLAVTSPSRNVIPVLDKLGLLHDFDYISDGNTGKASRAKVGRYLKLCEEAQVSPQECAVVEATKRGMKAGKDAGMLPFFGMDALLEYLG